MSHVSIGRKAEDAVAYYLQNKGYEIICQNWRTRSCEIDIVAQMDDVLYFVEVKYRQSNQYGTGLDFITPRKLKQMQYAANVWLHHNSWSGEVMLCAAEVSGDNFTVTNFVDSVTT